jgi:hypothetical protein
MDKRKIQMFEVSLNDDKRIKYVKELPCIFCSPDDDKKLVMPMAFVPSVYVGGKLLCSRIASEAYYQRLLKLGQRYSE